MRTLNLVPCDCGTCYFCRKGLTHGIDHRVRRADGSPGRLSPARKAYQHPDQPVKMTVRVLICGRPWLLRRSTCPHLPRATAYARVPFVHLFSLSLSPGQRGGQAGMVPPV